MENVLSQENGEEIFYHTNELTLKSFEIITNFLIAQFDNQQVHIGKCFLGRE